MKSGCVCVCVVVAVLASVGADAQKNIVETAVADGNFKTLAAALTEAKLVDALSGEGPFTVFAPTDTAFEAALKALGITAEELLARPDLGGILKFHVASGKVMSSDLSNGMKVPTLEGAELTVTIDGKTVKIGDATVTTADLECSNGVIHVIDKVLLPPAPVKDTPNIVQLGEAAGNFNTLVAAVKAAGLTETLSGAGPFTVFAPTDTAFEAALKALGITAEEALNLPNLGDILKFHVASGKVMSTDLSNGMKVPTLEGSELTVTIDGKTVKIGDATVTQADVEASNGVIHIIDKVLLPPSPTTTVAPGTSDGDATGSVDAASGGSARGFGGLLLAIALLARRV